MKRMELPNTPILSNKDAQDELIYSFLYECERLFGGWMNGSGFDFTDIRVHSFHNCRITYFGELMELIFGEFQWTKDHFLKIPASIFIPIMRRKYNDKKLILYSGALRKRYKIQNYSSKQ